ncbi:MAG: conjugative relaxase [Gammaproteobacteria bacterium]|nr:conjugative relaxase [Gammaproteobacteria bacterium]MYL01806.1 conjugative relaxase [Gammaproteobacteria bacterium]
MVASIGAVASPAQGASYYERDGYYAKDDPEHRAASAWVGRGAAEFGLEGPVDPDVFKAVLEGAVPDGSGRRLGKRGKDGEIHHRPGRDLTFSAPKSVSLAALIGGDARIVEAHDRAVIRALDWFEKNAAETRMQDKATGRMVRVRGQKAVISTFRHDTSRNLDPALHTHSVIANMLKGADGKWRTMANESLYTSKMLLGALYRSELAGELKTLGYSIEKTHADGRFEIAGVTRDTVEAFSTRRAEIEAAMETRGLGETAANPHLAGRAALMTRAHKRDVDKAALRETWAKQAADLGFDAKALIASAVERSRNGAQIAHNHEQQAGKEGSLGTARQEHLFERAAPAEPAREAVGWALAHLSERDAVFSSNDLFAAALAFNPGAASIGEIEQAIVGLKREGRLHDAPALEGGGGLTTDTAVAQERETVSLMRTGSGRGKAPMRGWMVDRHLRKGPLTAGQKQAVKLILSEKDRTVGVQGYAGTGKTRMLNRARALAEKKGWRMVGLAPSASAAQTLAAESGIESETLQRFLARNAGVAQGRLTKKGAKALRATFARTVLVVDEGSLASTVQARDLLRIASEIRIPKVVLVGDAKQLDAVDAGKPFSQLQQAGMKTAVMDEIMRQRNPDLKAAVMASLRGEIGKAFEKLGGHVAEVKPDNIAGAVAARWLKLSPEERDCTGVMAPSHELREGINAHIRERLAREGRIAGPAMETERLVSKGYTNAEKALAANYAPGDIVAFHRPYKRLGVEKGDERRVMGVDHRARTVDLEAPDGSVVAWKPSHIGGRRGGTEVYRSESIELRAGDRIRWTRNDAGLGIVNSGVAEVTAVRKGRVSFRLEDGRRLDLSKGDAQLRHLDHAWASTVHAFQGRTVDNVIAAMQANHPHLTTAKSFYVEISRARDRAELVTDDAAALKERLEAVTGERISALEGIGETVGRENAKEEQTLLSRERPNRELTSPSAPERDFGRETSSDKEPSTRARHVELEMGL